MALSGFSNKDLSPKSTFLFNYKRKSLQGGRRGGEGRETEESGLKKVFCFRWGLVAEVISISTERKK